MKLIRNIETIFDYIFNRKEYDDLGKTGERLTYRRLSEFYFKKQIFRNLYIKKSDGKFTEIDLVSVGRGSVIVYESKNYSGWIFGSDKDAYWTQTLYNRKKQKFYNPIWQNNTHIEALKEFLKDYQLEFFSIIVFSERCELKKVECNVPNTFVIKRNKLEKTVSKIRKNVDKTLTKEQLDEVIYLLNSVQRPEQEIKEQHIADIKQTLSSCPRCKSELVERIAKASGNKFIGCSSFPKCRYKTDFKIN